MNLEKLILEETAYRDLEPGAKEFSCSMFGQSPLQRALRIKHGNMPSHFGVNTIGSLVHLAIEHIFTNMGRNIDPEKSARVDLDNGWTLTGTADIIDHTGRVIYDIKNVKKYRVVKLKEACQSADPGSDDYVLQLNAYRYLFNLDYSMVVAAMSCDAGFNFKTKVIDPVYQEIDIPVLDDIEERIYAAIEATEEVLEYLSSHSTLKLKKHPSWCDTWPRKSYGPVRCANYCDYKSVCPAYNPNSAESVSKMWEF